MSYSLSLAQLIYTCCEQLRCAPSAGQAVQQHDSIHLEDPLFFPPHSHANILTFYLKIGPAEPSALSVLLLLVATLQAFEGLNVFDGLERFVEIVDDVSNERLYVLLRIK